jgi:hypothetical protein
MWRGWSALAVLCVVLGGPARGQPAGATASSEQRFAQGSESWGVSVAHGLGLGLFGSDGRDVERVELAGLAPRYGRGLTDPVGEGRWYHGNLELLLEGALLVAYAPKGGFVGGVNALLRYNFLGGSRFVPFLEIGVGVAGLELDLEDQADGLAFAPQGGLGLHWWLSRQLSLTAEWRLHHLSNADIHDDNAGINDSLLMVGLSWFP